MARPGFVDSRQRQLSFFKRDGSNTLKTVAMWSEKANLKAPACGTREDLRRVGFVAWQSLQERSEKCSATLAVGIDTGMTACKSFVCRPL
jgi:hypothetical protein